MPRNSNGTYTLPAGNPVVSGEVISSSWANPTMEDIANEITNSLDRSGRGGMQAPFKNFDGTQSAPGITWGNEPTTGFWRNAAQDMRVAVGGQPRERWTAAGVDIWNGTIWSPVVTNSTLETNLTAKGYAVKANNETISGAWTFSNSGTQTIAGYLKVGNGTASPGGRLLINSLSTEAAMIQLFKDTVASWLIGPPAASGDFVFTESGVERFRISNSGASVPGTLGVVGTSAFTGAVSMNGGGSWAGVLGGANGGYITIKSPDGTRSTNIASDNANFYIDTLGGEQYFYIAGAWKLAVRSTGVAVSGTLAATSTITQNGFNVCLETRNINTANTLTGGGNLSGDRTLQLVNDVAAPGSSWYYGTDAAGTKGWFPLSGVVGVPEAPIDGQSYARQNASWVSLGSAGSQYVLKTGDTMSGGLTISYAGPMFAMYDTSGPAEQKRFIIVEDSGIIRFKFTDDAWNVDAEFLSVSRAAGSHTPGIATYTAQQTYLRSSEVHVGPSNYYQSVVGATRFLGVTGEAGNAAEIGVFANDGTNNPRAAMFTTPTAIGIDYTYNTGVNFFDFRRAGATIFGYNSGGILLHNTLPLLFGGSGNAVQNAIYTNGPGQLAYEARSSGGQHVWSIDSILKLQLTSSYIGSWTNFHFEVDGGNIAYLRTGVAGGAISFRGDSGTTGRGLQLGGVDNTGAFTAYMQLGDSTNGNVEVLYGKRMVFRNSDNSQLLEIFRGSGYSGISESTGSPIVFYVAGPEMFRVDSDGAGVYNGRRFSFVNNAGTATTSLRCGPANFELIPDGAGAIQHWEDTGLTNGTIKIGTADPATTGTPGQMFLVYE